MTLIISGTSSVTVPVFTDGKEITIQETAVRHIKLSFIKVE